MFLCSHAVFYFALSMRSPSSLSLSLSPSLPLSLSLSLSLYMHMVPFSQEYGDQATCGAAGVRGCAAAGRLRGTPPAPRARTSPASGRRPDARARTTRRPAATIAAASFGGRCRAGISPGPALRVPVTSQSESTERTAGDGSRAGRSGVAHGARYTSRHGHGHGHVRGHVRGHVQI